MAPVVGAVVGIAAVDGDEPTSGMAAGVLSGLAATIIIDAAFLAHESAPRDKAVALGLAPMLDAGARPAGMSVRGAF